MELYETRSFNIAITKASQPDKIGLRETQHPFSLIYILTFASHQSQDFPSGLFPQHSFITPCKHLKLTLRQIYHLDYVRFYAFLFPFLSSKFLPLGLHFIQHFRA